MNEPRVSCIIPVYNGERFLDETLRSVFEQSRRCAEILVVDDGSTDGSAAVAARYPDRVAVIRQANAGHAAALNRGIASATGDLITFLDADDLWNPDKIERQVAFMLSNPARRASFTLVQNFWVDELQEEAERFTGHRISRPLPGYVAGTMMVWRSTLEAIGVFDASLGHGQVQEWVLRSRDGGLQVDMLGEVLLRRRLHYANRSRLFRDESRDEFLQLLKNTLDRRRR